MGTWAVAKHAKALDTGTIAIAALRHTQFWPLGQLPGRREAVRPRPSPVSLVDVQLVFGFRDSGQCAVGCHDVAHRESAEFTQPAPAAVQKQPKHGRYTHWHQQHQHLEYARFGTIFDVFC